MDLMKAKVDTSEESVEVDEDREERVIRAVVFPEGGGQPYVKDVEVGSDGTFELEHKEGVFTIQPGSVWSEGGTERCILHEERPMTVNPQMLAGEGVMSPETLHGIARNNLWVQLDEVSRRDSAWKNPQTYAFIIMGGLLLLLVFWQIKTTGDGFEQLADAIRSSGFGGGGGSGHQDISPGGR